MAESAFCALPINKSHASVNHPVQLWVWDQKLNEKLKIQSIVRTIFCLENHMKQITISPDTVQRLSIKSFTADHWFAYSDAEPFDDGSGPFIGYLNITDEAFEGGDVELNSDIVWDSGGITVYIYVPNRDEYEALHWTVTDPDAAMRLLSRFKRHMTIVEVGDLGFELSAKLAST